MKAVVQDVYGSADSLRFDEVATPEIGDDDVLVGPSSATYVIVQHPARSS